MANVNPSLAPAAPTPVGTPAPPAQASSAPTNKTYAATFGSAFGSAVALIVNWLLTTYVVPVPEPVQAAITVVITTIITFGAAYIVPPGRDEAVVINSDGSVSSGRRSGSG